MLESRNTQWAPTDVTVENWSTTLGVIVRQEQALEASEMSDWFCGLSVHHACINTEAGVMICRLPTRPAVIVAVAMSGRATIASTSTPGAPVVIVVVVVTVL